jgi:hypothetical protein
MRDTKPPIRAVSPGGRSANGISFEQRLRNDLELALIEGSLYFEERGAVFDTLRAVSGDLAESGVDFAVMGALAMFTHGYRRFTDDVDLLFGEADYARARAVLDSKGYRECWPGSRALQHASTGVRIDVYSVASLVRKLPVLGRVEGFLSSTVRRDRVPYVDLPTLLALKISLGNSAPDKERHRADAQELMLHCLLPREYAENLPVELRSAFISLWEPLRHPDRRFLRRWKHADGVSDWDALAARFPDARDEIERMRKDGVQLVAYDTPPAEGLWLVSCEPILAAKYELHDEFDYFQELIPPRPSSPVETQSG